MHDLAMRNLADEIIERLLVLPDGQCPEFAGERLSVEGVADEAFGGFQLLPGLEGKTEETGNGAEVEEGEIGDEREILAAGRGRRNADPGNLGHDGIVTSRDSKSRERDAD